MQKAALSVASLVFCAVSIAHFVRFYLGLDLIIGETSVSLEVSLIGGFVTAFLAVWMYLASTRA